MGYVSFGYESGQHRDPNAVENAKNFIRYTLMLTGTCNAKMYDVKRLNEQLLLPSYGKNREYSKTTWYGKKPHVYIQGLKAQQM
ncbi:MAG: hypothetical protein AAGB24_01375 [Bacteroidota bacterium]